MEDASDLQISKLLERRNVSVVVPDADESEVEDDEKEDEVGSFKIIERVVDSDAEEEKMSEDEDQDPDFNISVDRKNQEGQKSAKTKKDPVLRWRKKTSVQMDKAYIGEPFPELSQHEVTPL